MTTRILTGDCRDILPTLADESVHCVVTSPPYFGLRDYGHTGQIGLEPTPAEYVAELVRVFAEVRRVLRADGTLWLNLADSYAAGGMGAGSGKQLTNRGTAAGGHMDKPRKAPTGLKPKNLIGIPWRVAFALQADGWYLRQDIIWAKPNPMPESVTDRCTKSHEYLFLLARSERYHFDAEAIAEPLAPASIARLGQPTLESQNGSTRVPGKTNGNMKAVPPRFGGSKYGDDAREESRTKSGNDWTGAENGLRNRRSVWTIAAQGFTGAHFATFPPALVEPCILAGCPPGGVVLDPFYGAGTVGLVADRLGRDCIGIELNADYARIAEARIRADAGMFAEVECA